MDYDRTLRTEKIYDDHRKFLLKIIYDATGQPVVWVPSSKLLPVNVSRSSSGQITVLQRGPTVERVEYDAQGRLVSRVFADGRTWSYTYLEKVSTTHMEKVSTTHLEKVSITSLETVRTNTWRRCVVLTQVKGQTNSRFIWSHVHFFCRRTKCERKIGKTMLRYPQSTSRSIDLLFCVLPSLHG